MHTANGTAWNGRSLTPERAERGRRVVGSRSVGAHSWTYIVQDDDVAGSTRSRDYKEGRVPRPFFSSSPPQTEQVWIAHDRGKRSVLSDHRPHWLWTRPPPPTGNTTPSSFAGMATVERKDKCPPKDSLPCSCSSSCEEHTPPWHPRALRAVREMLPSCSWSDSKSLYLEMRNRRSRLCPIWDNRHLGRFVRSTWCVLTARFSDPELLVARLQTLPHRMVGSLICCVWMAAEPQNLWPGYGVASTCVVLMAGIPSNYSVRRVVQLLGLLDGVSPYTSSSQGHGVSDDWWLQPLADETDFDQWLGDHRSALRHAQQALELRPGDNLVEYSVDGQHDVGGTENCGSPPPYFSTECECSPQRQPLREMHANVAANRFRGGL